MFFNLKMNTQNCLIILFPFFSLISEAQSNFDSINMVKMLTGNSQKTWMFKGTIPTLGSGCKNGNYLIFTRDSVTEKNCNESLNQFEYKTYNWFIAKRNKVSWVLIYNDQKFALDFIPKGVITELVLSSLSIKNKHLIYIYEE
jgi:hypothetical protein